jgi:hypothetical protein
MSSVSWRRSWRKSNQWRNIGISGISGAIGKPSRKRNGEAAAAEEKAGS